MSPVSVNAQTWDDVEERERGDFPVLPSGLYEDCYLKDWEKRTSKKDSEYYSPEFVVSGEDGSESHIWGIWSTSAKARGFMKKDLAALGVDLTGVDITDEEELESRMERAKGESCRLRLKVSTFKAEDDDGNEIMKERNEIRAILPA